jgi:FdhD protein
MRTTLRQVRRGAGAAPEDDAVAVEEPLEIRVAGETLAITMRTPGDDLDLAVGFLFAEGVIRSADDVGAVAHCGRPDEEGFGNVVEVTAAPGAQLRIDRVEATRRGTLTTSACGVCGRKSVDDLLARLARVPDGAPIPSAVIAAAPQTLLRAQAAFARTGGTHGAAVLDRAGEVLSVAEDVGRHNAVDKAVGALVRRGLIAAPPPLASPRALPGARPENEPALLAVSGRASFEIVQKAAAARLPAIAAVGAASSLAVDLADRAGIALCTFVRGGRFNVYSHPARVRP